MKREGVSGEAGFCATHTPVGPRNESARGLAGEPASASPHRQITPTPPRGGAWAAAARNPGTTRDAVRVAMATPRPHACARAARREGRCL
eukprot:CAMPEP_0170422338 /NCGR_PEP_ID=MMETSP0117_2-20130122/36394_1 /TAXON_ID=400756 /ORGANISM="Durinskia baltica, Strain CSIRO CS-38" /LENGTH=89 /DNA_ID=CAMNT_0010680979 /DNA_START=8 /DNA_END=274 /DNA_ORIENTATION=-